MFEMGIGFENVKGIPGAWKTAARSCDGCKSAAAVVYCRVDSAFLCITCDSSGIHSSTRHERVWVCEVCEQAPSAVTCKADAATLCVSCDSDIHSANPLAGRHDRVPVEPFFDSAASKFPISSDTVDFSDDLGLSPWLITSDFSENTKISVGTSAEMKNSEFVFSDFDRLIDFEYPSSSLHPPQNRGGADSVVPVQTKPNPVSATNNELCFDIAFTYPTQSITHSVSNSSLDFGVVPDGSTSVSEISTNQQVCGWDREARVSRYREKRKNRKFEKTIRYASRKAYAESRPRIKGRFAKRSDADDNDVVLVGHVYATAAQYGMVPSF